MRIVVTTQPGRSGGSARGGWQVARWLRKAGAAWGRADRNVLKRGYEHGKKALELVELSEEEFGGKGVAHALVLIGSVILVHQVLEKFRI